MLPTFSPAPIYMAGEDGKDKKVRFRPGALSKEAIINIVVRTFWDPSQRGNQLEMEPELEAFKAEIASEVDAAWAYIKK